MSQVVDKTARILAVVGHAVDALETIGTVAKDLTGGAPSIDEIMRGVHAIASVVETVLSGLEGAIEPGDITKALADLRAKIADNDRAADAAMDAKFPK